MARPFRTILTTQEKAFADAYRNGGVTYGVAYARAHGRTESTRSDQEMGRKWWMRDTVKNYVRQCTERDGQPVEHPTAITITSPKRERAKRIAVEVENEKKRQDGEIDYDSWGNRSDLINNLKRLALTAFTDTVQRAATLDIARLTGQDWIDKKEEESDYRKTTCQQIEEHQQREQQLQSQQRCA